MSSSTLTTPDGSPPTEVADIAIVGAGAAGLAACIFAAERAMEVQQELRIVVLDGARQLGAKILVAGGGRCNVTHQVVKPEDFHADRRFVRTVLSAFGVAATVKWMERLGVPLKTEETGKLFPVSDSARSVLTALLGRASCCRVTIHTQHRVTALEKVQRGDGRSPQVRLSCKGGLVEAPVVILATGGRSLPKSGSDGSGFALAQMTGHTVTPTYPALVPLELDFGRLPVGAGLQGLSSPTQLETVVDKKVVDRRSGSMLWTHFGISGPVAMDASRFWVIANAEGKPVQVRACFLPGMSFEAAERWIIEAASSTPARSIVRQLSERIPRRLAEALCTYADVGCEARLGSSSRASRRGLVHALTDLELPVVGHRGWNHAEITAGGVTLTEVNERTMESRLTPGLFLAGEILDCDGRIGGFNFQWAWATGFVAGRSAVDLARATTVARGPDATVA